MELFSINLTVGCEGPCEICSGKSTGGVSPQSSSGSIGSRRARLAARYDGLLKYRADSSFTVSSSSQVDEDELDSPPSAPAGMYCLIGLNPWGVLSCSSCSSPPVAESSSHC